MAKVKTVFYCTECGNETPKWQGKCPSCGQWNTLQEHVEKATPAGKGRAVSIGSGRQPQRILDVDTDSEIRFSTGMGELA